jgi:ParB family chromosome partitioning protein
MNVLFDTTPEEKRVQAGQVWQLGQHLLYCGDSASDDFIRLCKQSQASFAFADPPYNAGVASWDRGFQWQHDYLPDVAPIVAVTPGIASMRDLVNWVKLARILR